MKTTDAKDPNTNLARMAGCGGALTFTDVSSQVISEPIIAFQVLGDLDNITIDAATTPAGALSGITYSKGEWTFNATGVTITCVGTVVIWLG